MTEQEWLESTDPAAMLDWLTDEEPIIKPVPRRPSDRKLRLFACACRWFRSHPGVTVGIYMEHRQWVEEWIDRGAPRENVDALDRDLDPDDVTGRKITQRWYLLARDPLVPARIYLHKDQAGLQANLLRDIIGNPFRPVALPTTKMTCNVCAGFGGHIHLMDKRHSPPPSPASAMNYEDYRQCGNDPWRRETDTKWLKCASCDGVGVIAGVCPWLTPTVLAVARGAYDERERQCENCDGLGVVPPRIKIQCGVCQGIGRIQDGTLDPVTLAILADALEEAGCDNQEILNHLRGRFWVAPTDGSRVYWMERPERHVRGCWALDLILGLE
jgi:hypothetical protein